MILSTSLETQMLLETNLYLTCRTSFHLAQGLRQPLERPAYKNPLCDKKHRAIKSAAGPEGQES